MIKVQDTDGLWYEIRPEQKPEFEAWVITRDNCGIWTGHDFSTNRVTTP